MHAEVLLGVLGYVKGGQELGEEVLARKAEGRPVVEAADRHVVVGADLLDGAAHPVVAVVVGGQRQRPRAETLVVVLEEPRGAARGDDRVQPFVDSGVDAHVEPARAGHELPHPRGAYLRPRLDVERRLDHRQPCDRLGYALLAEDRQDVLAELAGVDQAALELLPQAALDADAIRGLAPARRIAELPERIVYLAVVAAQRPRIRIAGGQVQQDSTVAIDDRFLGGLVRTIARGSLGFLLVDRQIDDPQIVPIVERDLVLAPLAVDPLPEIDGALESGRHGERVVGRLRDGRLRGQGRGHGEDRTREPDEGRGKESHRYPRHAVHTLVWGRRFNGQRSGAPAVDRGREASRAGNRSPLSGWRALPRASRRRARVPRAR